MPSEVEAADGPGDACGYPSAFASRYTLVLLWGVYVSNQWSRYILNYLYAISSDSTKYSISEACSLSASEYGLLTGYGFSATFVVTGLFMGRAADSYNRRNIITAGCFIWSIALAAQGLSSSFWELLVFRLLLGFGEAFSNPASYSMLADLFPAEKRPEANGIFASGVYIGGGLASISEAIAESTGWRAMMFITAGCGAAIASAMAVTVTEPKRQGLAAKAGAAAGTAKSGSRGGGGKAAAGSEGGSEEAEGPTAWETVKFLLTDPHTVLLLAAASVRFCGGYAIAGYLPTFFEEKYPSDTTVYAYINAYVVAFGGFMSSWLGGKITTAWIESGKEEDPTKRRWGADKANYYVPAIGALGGCPFFLVCLYANNFYVSLCVGLLGEYLVAECWFGPYMSALQGGVPATMRGLAVATMMLTANFFGSLTSYLVGVIQEDVDLGYKSLETILLVSVVGTYVLAALLFLAASRVGPSQGTDAAKAAAAVAVAAAAGGATEKTALLASDEEAA